MSRINTRDVDKITLDGLVFNIATNRFHDQSYGPTAFVYKKVLLKEPCVYCGASVAAGRDHIQPRHKGGKDNWTNRAPACRACDQAKGSRDLLMFLVKDKGRQVRLRRNYSKWKPMPVAPPNILDKSFKLFGFVIRIRVKRCSK